MSLLCIGSLILNCYLIWEGFKTGSLRAELQEKVDEYYYRLKEKVNHLQILSGDYKRLEDNHTKNANRVASLTHEKTLLHDRIKRLNMMLDYNNDLMSKISERLTSTHNQLLEDIAFIIDEIKQEKRDNIQHMECVKSKFEITED